MDRKKRAAIKRYIALGLAVLVTAGLAALPMLTAKNEEDTHKASILSASAEPRNIDRILIGGGSIEAKENSEVTFPAGVRITELLAANGDTVKEGDPIARVDPVSVMTAVKSVQDTLEAITKELYTASSSITPGLITADEEGNLYTNGTAIPTDKLSSYAKYMALSVQHREYEQLLLDLFRIRQNGTVNAATDGMIDGLDKSIVSKLDFEEGDVRLQLLAGFSFFSDNPEEDSGEGDEPEPPEGYGYPYAGTVSVIVGTLDNGYTIKTNPTAIIINDFSELGGYDVNSMTSSGNMTGGEPVYQWNAETEELELHGDLVVGDIVVRATNSEETLLIWVGNDPNTKPGGNTTGNRGGFSGAGGGSRAQAETSLYSDATTTLCTLVSQDTVVLTVSIDERDIALVSPGMTAKAEPDALSDRTFTAMVTNVSKFGASNGGSSKFSVELEMPWQEGMLPGMNGSAKMVLATRENVLSVPTAALVDRGSETILYTGYDEKNETLTDPVTVTTGLSDGEHVQILSGLEPGQKIWYSYYDTLEISNAVARKGMFG